MSTGTTDLPPPPSYESVAQGGPPPDLGSKELEASAPPAPTYPPSGAPVNQAPYPVTAGYNQYTVPPPNVPYPTQPAPAYPPGAASPAYPAYPPGAQPPGFQQQNLVYQGYAAGQQPQYVQNSQGVYVAPPVTVTAYNTPMAAVTQQQQMANRNRRKLVVFFIVAGVMFLVFFIVVFNVMFS